MQVIKRDGRVVEFNVERIIKAVTLAMAQTPEGIDLDLANKIAISVQKQFEDKPQTTVYEIQDAVEKKLMASSRKEVAQSYITYRYNRDIARKSKTKEVFLDIISAKANEGNKETFSRNTDTPTGMMMKFASETTKPFVDDFLLSREAREAVKNNYIFVHDEDYYPTKSLNCLQHPLNKILENGFHIGTSSSRPAQRIEAACALAFITMGIVQNEMHGGQSIPAFDYYLAPYVKMTFREEVEKIADLLGKDLSDLLGYQPEEYLLKDLKTLTGGNRDLQAAINNTVFRVHQAIEGFIHNMNTIHSKGGNQVVDSNINYGTDTSPEGRCIIRELLLSTEQGIGNQETPTYPTQIWKKKRGINYLPEDKNYDLYQLACKVASKRYMPNFLNLDASFNQNEKWQEKNSNRYQYECAVMRGRTRVFENRHGEKTAIGRGNLSYTTINLTKIAIKSAMEAQEKLGISFELGKGSQKMMTATYKKTVKKILIQKLEQYAEIVGKQLYDRYNFQCTAIAKQFPLLMSGLWGESEKLKSFDKVETVLKHGTLSIGYTGLAECLTILTGTNHGETEEAQNLGLEIVSDLEEIATQLSEKYDLNFNILATSNPKLEEKFLKKDQSKFGVILGVTDKEAYTNGNSLPTEYKGTMEEKAKIEGPYHKLTKGGNKFWTEMEAEEIEKTESLQKITDLIETYDIGYTSIRAKKWKCLQCGYESMQKDLKNCPNCGESF
ncbi:MAG: anaerobic ribonucleoside-triphosphate reductase [Clostridia bacterium]|nr:anaerobic ribonucleoside-triphosphate reductase [Clostridia bacterium]MCI9413446.1 anaerobic ribonucleoside-triphosphate reductase [Clostridia bacterium]